MEAKSERSSILVCRRSWLTRRPKKMRVVMLKPITFWMTCRSVTTLKRKNLITGLKLCQVSLLEVTKAKKRISLHENTYNNQRKVAIPTLQVEKLLVKGRDKKLMTWIRALIQRKICSLLTQLRKQVGCLYLYPFNKSRTRNLRSCFGIWEVESWLRVWRADTKTWSLALQRLQTLR